MKILKLYFTFVVIMIAINPINLFGQKLELKGDSILSSHLGD